MAQQIEVPIPFDTAYKLIRSGLVEHVNRDAVAECLMETMDKESIAIVIMLLQESEPYVPLLPGDYVKFHRKSAYFADKYDTDVLLDMGLMVDDYMFGRIPYKDDYGNTPKRFSPRQSVELLVYNNKKEYDTENMRLDTHNLTYVAEDDIPYLKNKRAQDI
jgi:hypothetical protein|tara:strand:- start:7144 stop:7626 length:483 start_codon:yes stop_codon:yes gene_type:complete